MSPNQSCDIRGSVWPRLRFLRPRSKGRECRSNLFSGPFCSCMRLSTRPSRYSGHELEASLSLSLSPPRSSPLLLQSRPVINIYVDLLSSGIGAEYGKKSPSLPRPYQLIASRYSSFSSFLLVSLAIFKFKKKGRVDGQGFPLTRKLRFVALLFVEMYAIYSLYRVICLLLTIQLGCCKNSVFVFYCKTIEIEAIFVDVTEIK